MSAVAKKGSQRQGAVGPEVGEQWTPKIGSNRSLDVAVSQDHCLLISVADAPALGDDEDGEDVADDTGEIRA